MGRFAQDASLFKKCIVNLCPCPSMSTFPCHLHISMNCWSLYFHLMTGQDDLLPVCNWCMTTNPLLRSNLDSCINCGCGSPDFQIFQDLWISWIFSLRFGQVKALALASAAMRIELNLLQALYTFIGLV